MGKCLVTKLQEAVNTDLPYFDAVRYVLPAGKAPTNPNSGASIIRKLQNGDDNIETIAPVGSVVTVISNGFLRHPVNETPRYEQGVPHTIGNETIAVIATDQTKPVEFIVQGFSSYSPGGLYQRSDIVCKDVDRFKYMANLKYLSLQPTPADKLIDLEKFLENPVANISNVIEVYTGGALVSGTDIALLSAFTGATTMQLANSNLIGTIESLVAAFRAVGRTAPVTKFVMGGNTNVTFEGNSVGSMWGYYTLSWTNNTISLTKNT